MSDNFASDSTRQSARADRSPLHETPLRSEQLLDGVLLEVYRDEVELPDGQTAKREWIDHPGEAPEEVGRRELEEETGLRAHTLHRVGATYPAIGYSNEIIHLFVAEDLERTAPDREEGEFMEVVPIGFAEALEKMRGSEVQDAKSVAALMMAEAFRRAGAKKLR